MIVSYLFLNAENSRHLLTMLAEDCGKGLYCKYGQNVNKGYCCVRGTFVPEGELYAVLNA